MYIFRAPAASYDLKLTFEGISDYVRKGRSATRRKLGTTIELRAGLLADAFKDVAVVRLYDTDIAYVNRDGSIEILEAVNYHGSQATTYWIQKVISDNGAPGYVARERGQYRQAGMKWTGKLWEERYPGAVRSAAIHRPARFVDA